MKKFILYTARFGTPGRFNIPKISIPNVDRVCFTDLDVENGCHQIFPLRKGKEFRNDFYDVVKMNLNHVSSMPIRRQRFVKICIPDEIFNNYEYSVYLDVKRPIGIDFEWILSYMKRKSDFLIRIHPERDCAYDEGNWLIRKGKFDTEAIQKQLTFYRTEGFPLHAGLYHTNPLLRRHTPSMKEFSNLWWEQIKKYSYRDQVSLPYVAWKHDMRISLFPRREK